LRLKAQISLDQGDTDRARDILREALEHHPEDPEVNLALASIYADAEQWAQVSRLIPQIRADQRLRDVALYLEGRVAWSQNRVGTARARFEEAIERQASGSNDLLASLYFYRGLCLDRLGRSEAADEAVTKAIDAGFQAETRAEAEALGRLLLRTGRAEIAVPQLEGILLGRDNGSVTLWSQLGRAHQMTDQIPLAISAFNQALELDPDRTEVLALRGSLLRRIGDLEGARSDYRRAAELNPDNAAFHYALGLAELQLGRLAEAEQALGQSAKLPGPTPAQQLLHALTAYAIGAHGTAREALQRYLADHPDEATEAAVYLAHLLQTPVETTLDDPVLRYFRGAASRKEVLDWAGYAETPADARRRICAAAFWLAQDERLKGNAATARELIQIALEAGSPESPEYQFAQWQLDADQR
ncbi:MAG: tetratricopeptide repeat protein, partial [Opitutales bacterium]